MRWLLYLCFAGSVLVLGQSCGTAQGSTAPREVDYSSFRTLADALRLKSGLQVEGGGTTAKVYIRGTSTIMLETQPLYVIDGNPIGHSYSMANSAINMNDVTNIRVLRSRHETTTYGKEGVNGVILITTRNTAN